MVAYFLVTPNQHMWRWLQRLSVFHTIPAFPTPPNNYPMAVFLFWNVGKKDLRPLICDAAVAVGADAVILVENGSTALETLERLQSSVSKNFSKPSATLGRFQVFTRKPELDLSQIQSTDRLSVRRLRCFNSDLLLGIVHVVDKMNWGSQHQASEVQLLASELRSIEDSEGHRRTLLIGDFNMNPHDQAMNLATGMNAMMTVRCASDKKTRRQQGRDYPFFYNPMWGLLGDRTPGPAGTFYHNSGTRGMFGWNMIDQVLVRPDAIAHFDNVEILTIAGSTSLATESGRPNSRIASDHFPLVLRLK